MVKELNGVAAVTKQALRGVSAVYLRRTAETMRSTTLAADTVGRRGLEWVVLCGDGAVYCAPEAAVHFMGKSAPFKTRVKTHCLPCESSRSAGRGILVAAWARPCGRGPHA
jgi:hypothetical protein